MPSPVTSALVSWGCGILRTFILLMCISKLYEKFCVLHFFIAAYGWVKNLTSDLESAILQDDIDNVVEGQVISLTTYFTKNGPRFPQSIPFTIETSGSATGMLIIQYQGVQTELQWCQRYGTKSKAWYQMQSLVPKEKYAML